MGWAQLPLEPQRVVTRATLVGVGYTNVYDTYLSPNEYSGTELRLLHERQRQLSWGEGEYSSQSILQGNVGYTQNSGNNGTEFNGLVNWCYGVHRHYAATQNLEILVGALGDANLGGIYNSRNSNNPAVAKVYINLTASAMARYRFRLFGRQMQARYQLQIPLIGVMFSPEYQQSYYEIFSLGNTSGTICFTSLHNQPSLRHYLTLDVPFRCATLRVGYVGDMQQSLVNNLRCHSYSHTAMVGFVKRLYLMK